MLMRILAVLRRVFHAGRGRPAAVAMLAGLAVLLQLPEWSPFQLGQLALFDRYQRVFPRERQSAPAVIVEIDEKSLKTHGQWPWPRDRLAALLRAIADLKPAAVGLDIYMPEADGTSPEALAARLPEGQAPLRKALGALPAQDATLADAIRRVPTVLGAAGFDFETLTTARGLRSVPLRVDGGDALPLVRQYPFVLASLPELQAAAAGQALLSVDLEGGVVRRLPLVMAVGDALLPSLAMEMLRVATGSTAVEVNVGLTGIDSVGVADLTVPTQPNGEVWLHFGPALEDRYVSAADLLAGRVPAAAIEGKLVLVGLTGFGLMDTRTTPLKDHVPGIDIQAQVLESFFDGRFLLRPAWMPWLETVLLLAGGLFLIWAVPNVKPRIATLLATVLFVILFGFGFALFRLAGLLLDAASVFAALNIVFGSLLSSVFIEADRQRRLAEAALHREREAAARVAGELAAARRIQLGSLPRAETAFPGETRFEVAAVLEPAREVGGDLYDFFMLDRQRLFFVVGDVSGKGVPASLFMAVAKALGKSVALRGEAGVAEILRCANEELSRENPEMLFVTMLAGILDVQTGDLALCNAGHDAPWRRGPGTAPEQLTGEGGPPLCVLEDFPYPPQHFRLAPGDSLFVVTDGITEAMNGRSELYGTERFAAVLDQAATDERPAALVARIREDVRRFVAGAEASDDLTLLVLRWTGP
ncbi:MAG: CHASE2 domain-containing protein [Rhodocyclaceae bacterium]|nr:CHASE2 domain-containing protein [Rhodocyclaceae bacterium]